MLVFLALLSLTTPTSAQEVIPLRVHVDSHRAALSYRFRGSSGVVCEHAIDPEFDAPPCRAEVLLPGPGRYTIEIDVLPGRDDVRSYRYPLLIAHDAVAATLELGLGYTYSPDTSWLETAWLDVERAGPPDGVHIDAAANLLAARTVLWPYGVVDVVGSTSRARSWCGFGAPMMGELVLVPPGVPTWLGGSGDLFGGEGPGTVLVRTYVHQIRASGTTASDPGVRPILRRTDRRWLEQSIELPRAR